LVLPFSFYNKDPTFSVIESLTSLFIPFYKNKIYFLNNSQLRLIADQKDYYWFNDICISEHWKVRSFKMLPKWYKFDFINCILNWDTMVSKGLKIYWEANVWKQEVLNYFTSLRYGLHSPFLFYWTRKNINLLFNSGENAVTVSGFGVICEQVFRLSFSTNMCPEFREETFKSVGIWQNQLFFSHVHI
jgi:hypothetical protein